jgi:hypothetical protein
MNAGCIVADHMGEDEGELTVAAGAVLFFGDVDHESGWTMATDEHGNEGFVPSDWLQVTSTVADESEHADDSAASSMLPKLRAAGLGIAASRSLRLAPSSASQLGSMPTAHEHEVSTITTTTTTTNALQSGSLVADYAGEEDGELTVAAGAVLFFGEIDHESGWTMAIDEQGNQGFVPSAWLEVTDVAVESVAVESMLPKLRSAGRAIIASQRLHPPPTPPSKVGSPSSPTIAKQERAATRIQAAKRGAEARKATRKRRDSILGSVSGFAGSQLRSTAEAGAAAVGASSRALGGAAASCTAVATTVFSGVTNGVISGAFAAVDAMEDGAERITDDLCGASGPTEAGASMSGRNVMTRPSSKARVSAAYADAAPPASEAKSSSSPADNLSAARVGSPSSESTTDSASRAQEPGTEFLQRGFLVADFAGEGDGELTVKEGEVLVFGAIDHDGGWTLAMDDAGNEGFVPSAWLEVTETEGLPDQASAKKILSKLCAAGRSTVMTTRKPRKKLTFEETATYKARGVALEIGGDGATQTEAAKAAEAIKALEEARIAQETQAAHAAREVQALEASRAAEAAAEATRTARALEQRQMAAEAARVADAKATRAAEARAAAAKDAMQVAEREASEAAARAERDARASQAKAAMEAKEAEKAAEARRARNAMAADADLEEAMSALAAISSVASKVAGARFWAPPSQPLPPQQIVTQTGASDAQDEELATLKARLAAALSEIP